MAGIYDEEIIGAREQAETARKLRELGVNSPKGQMVSGWYVRPSITQYLAEGLKGYGNVQREKEATAKYEGLRKEKTGKITELLNQFPTAKESYPNAQIGADGPTIEAQGAPVVTQPDGQDYMKWAVDMSQYSPETATLGSKLAEYDMTRKDKKEQAQERLEDRQTQREWQAQQAQMAREQNSANQQANARLVASLRPPAQEPLVAVMGKDGNPVMLPRSQAVGMTPFNATTVKIGDASEKAKQGTISAQQALDQAETLFKHPGRKAATGMSSFVSAIPGTDAKGFQSNLDTFKAQTFVPMVAALKGMGALSDAEGKKLTDAVGALDPKMKEEEFAESLRKVTKTLYDKAKESGFNVSMPEFAAGQGKGQSYPIPTKQAKGSAQFLGFE